MREPWRLCERVPRREIRRDARRGARSAVRGRAGSRDSAWRLLTLRPTSPERGTTPQTAVLRRSTPPLSALKFVGVPSGHRQNALDGGLVAQDVAPRRAWPRTTAARWQERRRGALRRDDGSRFECVVRGARQRGWWLACQITRSCQRLTLGMAKARAGFAADYGTWWASSGRPRRNEHPLLLSGGNRFPNKTFVTKVSAP